MPNVTASTSDGYVGQFSPTSSATSRNATTAGFSNNTLSLLYVVHAFAFGRYYLYRSILWFDLSGNDDSGGSLSGNTVTGAVLKIYNGAAVTGFFNWGVDTNDKFIVAKTDGAGDSLSTADFNAMDNWPSSGTYEGTVEKYGEVTQAQSAWHNITLSAQAVTDINSAISSGADDFSMMLLCEDDWTHSADLHDNGAFFEGGRFHSANNSSNKPYLELTYGAAASGYSHDVMGVSTGDISKVKGVATADIEKVIGV